MPDEALSIGLFRGLEEGVAKDLLQQAKRRLLAADTLLFAAGEPARAVHVLVSGVAQLVQSTPRGSRVVIKYVGAGEVFGSPALLDRFYPVDAVAITECEELQWPAPMLRAIVDRHPQVALNVIRDLEARLREMEDRVRDLSGESVEHRLARAVLKLVERFGIQVPEGIEIPFPVSRQDLADLIGSTLPTVSRTLRNWETQRQIRRHRRRLVIADIEAVAGILYNDTPCRLQVRRGHRRSAWG
ncbi:Crp/Fnr family transcriptional regulator [Microvirga sp. KLBC 81]|uniref:Crp/Fnr family transcriptional regulator n=1 Tax=Microvirga sp. KLBC 81 TaxID=1862707 RepID=UPI000D51963D|nr:Crp/Fnr family transcriptional regulator [Microvirga sp. KLBC 81]